MFVEDSAVFTVAESIVMRYATKHHRGATGEDWNQRMSHVFHGAGAMSRRNSILKYEKAF
jgi:hypothetical protein